MAEKFSCSQCGQEETKCDCEKYCIWCQSQHDVRLCADGTYYCINCREAGDLQAQIQTE